MFFRHGKEVIFLSVALFALMPSLASAQRPIYDGFGYVAPLSEAYEQAEKIKQERLKTKMMELELKEREERNRMRSQQREQPQTSSSPSYFDECMNRCMNLQGATKYGCYLGCSK